MGLEHGVDLPIAIIHPNTVIGRIGLLEGIDYHTTGIIIRASMRDGSPLLAIPTDHHWYRRLTEIVKVTGSNLTGAPNSEKLMNRDWFPTAISHEPKPRRVR